MLILNRTGNFDLWPALHPTVLSRSHHQKRTKHLQIRSTAACFCHTKVECMVHSAEVGQRRMQSSDSFFSINVRSRSREMVEIFGRHY